MLNDRSFTATTGRRLFACSVLAVVLVAASAIGLLQAVSDDTGGETFWLVVGTLAFLVTVGVVLVAAANLVRQRESVISTAALLVATVPLVGMAAFLAPVIG